MMSCPVKTAIALVTVLIAASPHAAERPLRLVTVAGQAEVMAPDTNRWTAATLRADLEPGSVVRTQAGRATLLTPNGQAVRVAGGTRIALPAAEEPDAPTRVRLDAGLVWVAVLGQSPPETRIQVETNVVTVTVSGSGVGVELQRDGAVHIRVYHGRAECGGSGSEGRWSLVLAQDQELLVSRFGTPAPLATFKRDKTDSLWVQWNEEQDAAGGYGARITTK